MDLENFFGAIMSNTIFGNVDLSEAVGLETVVHGGPSTIGIDSIFRSKGKIPEIFLRGAGVPEGFITFMKSLVVNPIEYYSCFISFQAEMRSLPNASMPICRQCTSVAGLPRKI
jgi:hypothetical protein